MTSQVRTRINLTLNQTWSLSLWTGGTMTLLLICIPEQTYQELLLVTCYIVLAACWKNHSRSLQRVAGGNVLRQSVYIHTSPMGRPDSPPFVSAALSKGTYEQNTASYMYAVQSVSRPNQTKTAVPAAGNLAEAQHRHQPHLLSHFQQQISSANYQDPAWKGLAQLHTAANIILFCSSLIVLCNAQDTLQNLAHRGSACFFNWVWGYDFDERTLVTIFYFGGWLPHLNMYVLYIIPVTQT